MVSQKNPKIKPITPINAPTFAISLVSTRPVEDAMAFGGVEIGKSIANEAQEAMNTIMAFEPPSDRNSALLAAEGSASGAITDKVGQEVANDAGDNQHKDNRHGAERDGVDEHFGKSCAL